MPYLKHRSTVFKLWMRELISRKVGKGGEEIIFFNKCGDGGGGFEWVEENLWWGGEVDTMEETMLKLTLL